MKKLSKKIRFLMATLFAVVLAVCAVGFAACSSTSDGETKNTTDLSVGLNYYSMTLEPGGDSFALMAVVSGTHTGGYEWSTSSNVVTLAPAGDICVVTSGNVEGYAKVTLTVDNLSASCDVYVAQKVVAESIELNPSSLELAVGEEKTVGVTVNMTDNTTSDDFSFSVSDAGVVTVTKTGSTLTVKAVSEGEATITVKADGAADATITVKVTAETSTEPELTGVTLDPETLALDLGGTTTGTITAAIADEGYSYTWTGSEWSSSDETIATVSANGNTATVTAIGVGTATITVKLSETVSASCVVTVTNSSQVEPEPTVESITLDPNSLTLTLGADGTASGSITATVAMSDSSEFSGDLEISAVEGVTFTQTNASGVVTITATATAAVSAQTVTVSSGEKSATFTLTVNAYVAPEPTVESITLDPSSLTLTLDENNSATGTVTATVTMSDNSPFAGELTISEIAGVTFTQTNNDGTVTITVTATAAVSAQTVTVSSEEKSATFTLTVEAYVAPEPELKGVTLDPTTLALDLNGTTTGTITATIADSDYSYTWTGSEWSSDSETIAAVSANGNTATVTAVGVGTTTITVKLSGTVSATCQVTVADSSPAEPELKGVTLDPTSLTLDIYDNPSGTITATIEDVGYGYSWTGNEWSVTGNTGVVEIQASGATLTVTAVAVGTTQITITLAEGISATCNITVTDSTPETQLVVESVTLTPSDSVELTPGDTAGKTVTSTVTLGTGSRELTSGDYSWTYEGDSGVTMTVSEDGQSVTLVAADGASRSGTLKLEVGGQSVTCAVTIASGSSEPGEQEHTHELTKVEATEPTCDTPGNSEYWTCNGCDKIFKDESGEEEYDSLAETVIPATGHSWKIDEESWTWDFTNGNPVVSVTFDCENGCGTSSTVNAVVTQDGDTYTATVTGPDGKEYTDTCTASSDEITIELNLNIGDLGDDDCYEMDANGVVKYKDGLENCGYYANAGYLATAEENPDSAAASNRGYTNLYTNGTSLNGYFIIDLTGYTAKSVTLTLDCYTTASTKKGVLALVTGVEGQNDVWGTETISVTGENRLLSSVSVNGTRQTLTLTADVAGLEYVYLEFNAPLRIYGMTLTMTLGEAEEETEPEPEAIYTVTVSAPYGKERININEEMNLIVTVTDAQGDAVETSYGDISWTVDNANVITLEADTGHITGYGVGTAIITATYTDSDGNYGTGVIYITVVSAATQAKGEEYDIDVNFSQYGDKVGTDTSVSFDGSGVVTYVDWDTKGSVTDGALDTTTFTYNNGANYTNYILIDFTAFMGYNFEISVTFSGETGAILAIVDTLSEEDGQATGKETTGGGTGSRFGTGKPELSDLVDAGKGAKIDSGDTTFTYSGQIYSVSDTRGNVNDVIYIVWDSAISISGITIELWTGDKQVKLDENWAGLNIDFSNPPESFREYYEELNSGEYQSGAATVVLEEGVLTLIDSDNDTNWTSGQRYMETKYESGVEDAEFEATGYTHESVYDVDDMGITNYFAVSLHGLEGKVVTITVVFSTADGAEGTMYIVDTLEGFTADHGTLTGTALASASGTKDKKLSAAVTVPSDGMLYIEYNTAMYIYSIKIEVGEKVDTDPVYSIEIDTNGASTTVTAGEQGLTITARVYKDGSEDGSLTVEWKSDDPEIATIENGTVTGVSEGETYVYAVFKWGDGENEYIESGKIKITVREPVEEGSGNIFIDFSDYSTWGYLESASETQDLSGDGKLKFVPSAFSGGAGNAIPHMTQVDGTYALQLGTTQDYGATSAGMSSTSGTKYNYFIIDTSEATTMSVTMKFSKINSSATDGYVALIGTNPDNITMATLGSTKSTRFDQISSYLIASDAYADTNGTSTVTFTYTADVSSRNAIYIVLGTAMYIYSIDITLSDEAHEHSYQITGEWTWNEDYTKCYAEATCTGETGICSAPTATVYAEVSSDITAATCETDGSASYTATYEGDVVGTVTVTYGTATGHAVVGTYSDGAWTYACANDDSESFEDIGSITGAINSITLDATDDDTLSAAFAWTGATDVVPVVRLTGDVTISGTYVIQNTTEEILLLDADITLTTGSVIVLKGTLTIDLNGHTISKPEYDGENVISDTYAVIQVGSSDTSCGCLTLIDSVGTGKISGWTPVYVCGVDGTVGSGFYMYGGTLESHTGYGLSTNGLYPAATAYIYAGTITSDGCAVYLPSGTLYLYGGEITGYTGIEVRGGRAYIMGGTITSTATEQQDVDESTSNGRVADGYAIAITWNSSYSGDALVEISGAGVTVNGVLYASEANAWRFDIFAGTFSEKTDEAFIRDGFAANYSGEFGAYVIETTETGLVRTEVKSVNADFSDSASDVNGNLAASWSTESGLLGTVNIDTDGVIQYTDYGLSDFSDGVLRTAYSEGFNGWTGVAQGTTDLTNYFIINLGAEGYEADYIDVAISFSEEFEGETGIIALASEPIEVHEKDAESLGLIAYASTSDGTFSWSGSVADCGDAVYIVYGAAICVTGISVKLYETSGGGSDDAGEKVVLEEIHVDFSDESTINSELMDYMTTGTAGTTAKVDVEGHITYNDEGWESMIMNGHLETLYVQGGLSSYGVTTGEQNYFIIDLSGYIGSTATISLKIGKYSSWETGIVGFDTSVYSMEGTADVPSTMLASLTSYADSGDALTLTWEIAGDGILYLMYSQPIYIYSIDIVIESKSWVDGEAEADEKSVIDSFGQDFSSYSGTFKTGYEGSADMYVAGAYGGTLTYVETQMASEWQYSAGYITTGASASADNYFVVDLSEYAEQGCDVEITISFSLASGVSAGTLSLVTESGTVLGSQSGTSGKADFEWSGSVDECTKIYIVYDVAMWMYDIEIAVLG